MAKKKPQPTLKPFGDLPPGVKTVNVEIPIFEGIVDVGMPDSVDKMSVTFLSPAQRAGVNRVFKAISMLGLRDGKVDQKIDLAPAMTSRAESARWVFSLIELAAMQQHNIEGHAEVTVDERGRILLPR